MLAKLAMLTHGGQGVSDFSRSPVGWVALASLIVSIFVLTSIYVLLYVNYKLNLKQQASHISKNINNFIGCKLLKTF